MKHILTLFCCFFLSLTGANAKFLYDSGGYSPHFTGFSGDSKYILIECIISEAGKIDIVSIISGERKRSLPYKNRDEKESLLRKLRSEGYVIVTKKSVLPDNLSLTHHYSNEVLKFYCAHKPTGTSMLMHTFDLPEIALADYSSTYSQDPYISPDGKNIVVMAYIPMGEAAGTNELYIINSEKLSVIYNSVGYGYYRKKDYRRAALFFEKAINFNSRMVKAIYNCACMYALMNNAQKSVAYLNRLKSIHTNESKKYIAKVKTDSDFKKIRNDPVFKKWK